jgi:hypothetical protein
MEYEVGVLQNYTKLECSAESPILMKMNGE